MAGLPADAQPGGRTQVPDVRPYRRTRLVHLLVAATVVGLLATTFAGPVAARPPGPGDGGGRVTKSTLPPPVAQVLHNGLDRVADQAAAGKPLSGTGLITRIRNGRGEVAVTIAVDGEPLASIANEVRHRGGTITHQGTDRLEAYVPASALPQLGALAGVAAITPIVRPLPGSWVSPTISLYGTRAWQQAGYDGSDVKVGIIDVGFAGLAALRGTELPETITVRCYPQLGTMTTDPADCEAGREDHGTSVAELIVDMAPGAQLFLANPWSQLELLDTIRWMTTNGVRIINASWSSGWLFDGPGDGTPGLAGTTYEAVDLAAALDALWVNSAGNAGDSGWSGPWRDEDADGYLDFAPGDDTNAIHLRTGQYVRVALRWSDVWGESGNDYDLLLLSGKDIVAWSAEYQTGDGDPFEILEFRAPATGDYQLMVPMWDAEPVDRMDILIASDGPVGLEHRVRTGTLPSPADSANPAEISVGAIDLDDGTTIREYSSAGPTADGRIKPDLVAADCMSTMTYHQFCGTSATAPETVGAAALIAQAHPAFSATDLASYLRNNAVALGDPSPGPLYGWGRLNLGTAPATHPAPSTVTLAASRATVTWPDTVSLRATVAPGVPEGSHVQFQSSRDGTRWATIGDEGTDASGAASLAFAPTATLRYRAMALGTSVVSRPVTVVLEQRLVLRASVGTGGAPGATSVAAGTGITFTAVVRPALGTATAVEYSIFRRAGTGWLLDQRFTVRPGGDGSAVTRIQLGVRGEWQVTARALATSTALGSVTSPAFRYSVTGGPTLSRTWQATIGSLAVTLNTYGDGTGGATLHGAGSVAGTADVAAGTCARPGRVAASLGRVPATGTSAVALPASGAAALDAAAQGGGSLVLRLHSGSALRCAPLVARPVIVALVPVGSHAVSMDTSGSWRGLGSGIAVAPTGVWVTNGASEVSRIDPATNVVTNVVPTGYGATNVAADGETVWVATASGVLPLSAATLELGSASAGQDEARVAEGGGRVWVVTELWDWNEEDERIETPYLYGLDPADGSVTDTFQLDAPAFGVAYGAGSAWVTQPGTGTVVRIDPTGEAGPVSIDVPGAYEIVASDTDVWVSVHVARAGADAIVRIDPKTNEVTARVVVGYEPAGMAIVRDAVYVAMAGEPTVVEVRGGVVTARIGVGGKSTAIAAGGGSLWVLQPAGSTLAGPGVFGGVVVRLNL